MKKQIARPTRKLVTITRRDLTPGYQLAQTVHVVADYIFQNPFSSYRWNKTSNYLVTLSVPDEQALLKLADQFLANGIKYTKFQEPDINNQVTALCMEQSDVVRKLCSNFPLALKEYKNK